MSSLAVLFASSIAGFLIVEQEKDVWLPQERGWIAVGLLASTTALLVNGFALQRALMLVRAGTSTLGKWLHTALAAALFFLVLQVVNWLQIYWQQQPTRSGATPHSFFYFLTWLHALHVLGGLPPLFVVFLRGRRGSYTRESHGGLLHCTMYWHFLDGVWLTTLAVLLLIR